MEQTNKKIPFFFILSASVLIVAIIAYFFFLPTEPSQTTLSSCPDENHPHLIDLGLPSKTLWACSNVGAVKPQDIGDYYAWGETEGKEIYELKNYKYFDSAARDNGKHYAECFQDIGKDIAGTEYDVAYVKSDGKLKMPSKAQCQELIDKCTFQWCSLNGVRGAKMVGPNGNFIFLPAAGFKKDEVNLKKTNGQYWMYGLYWTSTRYENPDSLYHAYRFFFNKNRIEQNSYHRYYGRTIRPVAK